MARKKTVFIIDDDPDDIGLFMEAVAKIDADIHCITALNGRDALARLKESSDIPDMIFLDLNMPGVSGMQCLREIKRTDNLKDIPVAIFTTSALQKDIEKTKKLGALYFITKPSSFKETCDTISLIIQAHVR